MSNFDIEKLARRDFLRALSGGALALASGSLLAGCGGAGSGSTGKAGAAPSGTTAPPAATGSARAAVHITWPKPITVGSVRSRLIPVASTAVKITIANGTTPVASHVISAPDTSYSFDALPVGSLTVTCAAYPDATAAGVAQAVGTGTLVTQAGQTASLTVTMDSTVDHLTIMPVSATVAVGATTTLGATAYDAAGAIVLIAPSKLQWQSSGTSVATVDQSSGMVTGVTAGTAGITVTDTESQKTSPPITLTVTDAKSLAGSWVAWYGDDLPADVPGGIQLSLVEDRAGNISGSVLFNNARQTLQVLGKRTGSSFQFQTIPDTADPGQSGTFTGEVSVGGLSASGTLAGTPNFIGGKTVPFTMVPDGQPVLVVLLWQGGGPTKGFVTPKDFSGSAVGGSAILVDSKGRLRTYLPKGAYTVSLDYTADQAFELTTYASGTVTLSGYFQGQAGSGTSTIGMNVNWVVVQCRQFFQYLML